MTYTQALMIIRNPDTYSREKVRAAAIMVLGSMSAKQEDLLQASSLL